MTASARRASGGRTTVCVHSLCLLNDKVLKSTRLTHKSGTIDDVGTYRDSATSTTRGPHFLRLADGVFEGRRRQESCCPADIWSGLPRSVIGFSLFLGAHVDS